jgi:drug/metabolite transporter (DMT)-like permease
MVIEPIWTTMLAASWFGESLSGSDLVGCVLIFLSLIINRWSVMRGFFRQVTA